MAASKGIRDWLIQRMTAVYLLFFTALCMWFYLTTPVITYDLWSSQFNSAWTQVATVLALLAVAYHAWIGIWTVAGDYLKCTCVRLSFLGLVLTSLLGFVIWGLFILWS